MAAARCQSLEDLLELRLRVSRLLLDKYDGTSLLGCIVAFGMLAMFIATGTLSELVRSSDAQWRN